MESNSTQKLIERYFENDLSGEEMAAFQKRLSVDPGFAKSFQFEKELMEGIEAFGNEQLRKQLETIHAEETGESEEIEEEEAELSTYVNPYDPKPKDGKVVNISRRIWWLAAAVLVLGLIARLLFWDNIPTPQQLYAIYAVHDFDFTEKSGTAAILAEAESLLKNKKYKEAIPVLENYLSNNPNDGEIQLAKGIAHLEINDFEKAIEIFDEVGKTSPILKNEGIWYKGLAYLKMGDVGKARNTLSGLEKGAKRYGDAKNLMKRLIELVKSGINNLSNFQ